MRLLEVSGLSKSFGGVQALLGLEFSVEQGGLVGVMGPNGAGKTTLFNCLSGLDQPSQGGANLRGRELGGLRPDQVVRLGLARTFQTARVFGELTALENVMVGRYRHTRGSLWAEALRLPWALRQEEKCRADAARFLERAKLLGAASKKASQLTLSETRRLELARVLATEPTLLLLDEPCAGLDQHERRDLTELLRGIHRSGVTLLIIEHDLDLLMDLCERVLVLNFGRIIAWGTPDEVRSDPEVLAAYLGEQGD